MSEPGELPAILGEFLSYGVEAKLEKGDLLWKEGDPGDHVALLLDGHLEVSHATPSGNLVPLAVLELGAVVGDLACFDKSSRSATVRAISPCRLLRMPAATFRKVVQGRPDLLQELFWLQVERVRRLTNSVVATFDRAFTDPLTHVYTRGFLEERLRLELARAIQKSDPICLVLAEVDNFKHYNETNGDERGDRALVEIAGLFNRTVRRGDILARYSGAEFAVLLYGAVEGEGLHLANRLCRRVAGLSLPGAQGQPAGKFTLTVGVATYPTDAANGSAMDLVSAAQNHLRQAKDSGRNCVFPARARA